MAERLTRHDANVVILELEIRGLGRLEFDSPDISDEENKLLREARDRRVEVLRQNLIHARKVATP
jgi:hypothetical protein